MIIIEEILIANGISILAMLLLLNCRRTNRESIRLQDKMFDGMAIMNLLGALSETISFLIDGKNIPGGREINYLLNSICFLGTVTIGALWCLYVELHVRGDYQKMLRKVKIVMIPWLIEAVAIIVNLFGIKILFEISGNNVYRRSNGAIIGYLSLIIYFVYSIYLVYHGRKSIKLRFFPVMYFVIPCFMGVVIQLFCYGITTSWLSVAFALTYVQIQVYAENIYLDELSELYNRRYLNRILMKKGDLTKASLYGIMMDINDFKRINDCFGHNMGDQAIRAIGEILSKSVSDNGVAIRYAGDEFIVLLYGVDEAGALSAMNEIRRNLLSFSESGLVPYTLSVSMGSARFGANDDTETFLKHMDEVMYEEKRKYHSNLQNLNSEITVLHTQS